MSQHIAVNHSVCTGCRECEVVCSLNRFGESNPDRSAIRVLRRESDGLVFSLPLVCQQCDRPSCMEVCPTGSLSLQGLRQILTVEDETCTGCGECATACPAGCIFMDNKSNVVLSCDLCGGEPQCVSLCHSYCLTLSEDGDGAGDKSVEELATIIAKEGLSDILAARGGI